MDLNLLVALDALLSERSVTRAAQRVGLSQPGMSNALRRLRVALDDPLLVRRGAVAVARGADPEGFSAGARQFDSDITDGRHPRAALAVTDDARLLAVACDGRADDEAGLTLAELAEALVALGATSALNLDGGGSTSLVAGGELVNVPRAKHGVSLPAGRPVPTALAFAPR